MISIIIPFYNRVDLIVRRMMEIHSYIHHPNKEIEILMINNGSNKDLANDGRIYYWQKMVNWFSVRYLTWETNIGFGGAMNRGAEKAKGDQLIFLSDDVRIKGDFISEIKKILDAEPKTLIGGEIVWWPGGWNEFEIKGEKIVIPYANGWLLACTKETWKESGGFDPIYTPYDFEDLDLSTRWHEMEYPIKALNSQYLQHIGGATIGSIDPNRMENTQKHRQKFIAKWADKLLDLNV